MQPFLNWLKDLTAEGFPTYGNTIALVTLLAAILALVYVIFTARKVLRFPEGTDSMIAISRSIRTGANAYLKRQYRIVGIFFLCMFLLLEALSLLGYINPFVPFAFVSGGFFSALSGFIGMKIATAANARTANACRTGLNRGLRVAFSAGSVMGLTVVGLGLLDISIWFLLLKLVFHLPTEEITGALINFGMGASSMALFARVGGGIFTKAADVGADLVGKVEAGIPEDDPRNPATIADNVGDNVGDVAGMGADLYESYVGSILATFALGVAAYPDKTWEAMLLPIALAVVGILCSIFGSFLIRTKEGASQRELLGTLRKGTYTAAVLAAVIAAPLTYVILGNWGVYVAILCGLIGGCAIGYFTEYYTSDTYKP
ncbi:MAG: sodium/proton-translocating pyrophosphatase, partial [Clostridia bacterium]|nr:sodium/proton-translocating pyrophosphatase [Clostridia bacterium]